MSATVPRQVIEVEVASSTATKGTLRLVETIGGVERVLVGPAPARVGRSGVSASHREGDGTTPLGRFRITGAFGLSASPKVSVAYRRVHVGDCWISASGDASYNRLTRRGTCASPNEDLWQIAKAGPYEYGLVTSYNTNPVVPGKGSAIFIHVNSLDAAGRSRATSGCVSVARNVMKRLFALLEADKRPVLIVRVKTS